jgi:iron complex outermembrane receptor protein
MKRASGNRAAAAIAAGVVLAIAYPAAEASAEIENVVVTARKREEPVQEVPLAITAISGVQMEKSGIDDLGDLQYQTASLFLRPASASSQSLFLIIRGQSQADTLLTTDSSVGVYVDNVYVPRQLGLKGALYDIERVEVIKGPQGTLFGRNTTGGAINITTKRPDYDGFHGFIEGEYGRFDRTVVGGAINIPVVQDKFAVRLTGKFDAHDGYGRSLLDGSERADNEEYLARIGIVIDPTEKLNISITGDYQHLEGRGAVHQLVYPGTFDPANGVIPAGIIQAGIDVGGLNPADIPNGPTFLPGVTAGYNYLNSLSVGQRGLSYENYAQPFEGVGFETYGIGGTITVDLDWSQIKSVTGYREFNRFSRLDLDASEVNLFRGDNFTKAHFFSQELQLLGTSFDDKLEWVVGGFYSDEGGNDVNTNYALNALNPFNPNISDGLVTNKSWAIFAQTTYHITDALSLTAGGRYTKEKKSLVARNRFYNGAGGFNCNIPTDPAIKPDPNVCEGFFSDTFDGWSWLFSADYKVTDGALVYAKTSRSFRGGGQNLRGTTDPTSFTPFAPEFAQDYEIGVKADFLDRRVRLNLAGYITDYNDIQRSVIKSTPQGGIVTLLQNAAKGVIKGFELEATAIPVEGLTLKGTVSLTDAKYKEFTDVNPLTGLPRDRSGEPFVVPKWTYSASARYDVPIGENTLGFQVDWYYQSGVNFLPAKNAAVPAGTGFQNGYGLLNARIDFEIEAWGVEVALYGKNLTNEKYLVDAVDFTNSALSHASGVIGEPRIWGIQLKKKFGAN